MVRERERERVCVCVCVSILCSILGLSFARERERERASSSSGNAHSLCSRPVVAPISLLSSTHLLFLSFILFLSLSHSLLGARCVQRRNEQQRQRWRAISRISSFADRRVAHPGVRLLSACAAAISHYGEEERRKLKRRRKKERKGKESGARKKSRGSAAVPTRSGS